MLERGVSADDLITLITKGEIIEKYSDEYRCPAVLMLGQVRGVPHHIVVAISKDKLIMVTLYLQTKTNRSIIGGGNKMDPGECLLCKSKMREGTTEFVARIGEQVVVIKNIPAFVCPNCDEAYYSIDTQRKIDRIMKAFHEGKLLARALAAERLICWHWIHVSLRHLLRLRIFEDWIYCRSPGFLIAWSRWS